MNMSSIRITSPAGGKPAVIPVESPTVPKAEIASKSSWSSAKR